MALPRNGRKAVANIFYTPDATFNGGDASRVGFSATSGHVVPIYVSVTYKKIPIIMKRIFIILYTLMLIVLGAATLIEDNKGTEFATDYIYGSPWFIALWGVLAAGMVAAIVKWQLWHRFSVMMLHLSFIVILTGAFTTFATSQKGVVHLVNSVPVHTFQSEDLSQSYPLPFAMVLDSFSVQHYPGTMAAADYTSAVTITPDTGEAVHAGISMNNIVKHSGYRFYQSSYDEDGRGSWLSVNYDPYGTGITYLGYLLLAVSMCMVVCDRREELRRLLKHPLLRKGGLLVIVMTLATMPAMANRTLPAFNRAKADSLAVKQVVYNDRVAPFNTLARDFVLKLYGSASYHDLTPEQVVSGWLLRPDVWQDAPMILVKNAELRRILHLDTKYARLTDLFDANGYILQRYWHGGDQTTTPNDPLQKAIAEVDEKLGIIMMLQKGTLIKPLPKDGSVQPLSPTRIKAELLYNRVPFAKVLFMVCLTLGFVAFGRLVYRNLLGRAAFKHEQMVGAVLLYAATLTLAFAFGLRWYVAGHVPMSNGFETMQFMALATLVVSCLTHRRFGVMLPFGLILSGFALLVSFMGQSNPQITNLMPVLVSPWLSLHVSVVMMGYALLAFTMLTGIMGLCMKQQAEQLMLLGRLLLYPAVFCLGIGIFLGAVWANQSWGAYWSWDPKETWALITFMTYAIAFHAQSLPWLKEPRHFHWFCTLAFLTVLMTYFGVNFVLGGMHSYAG